MKRKVRMLEDYYPTEYISDGVWWAGDVVEIDEIRDQVSVDYLIDAGYCEEIEDEYLNELLSQCTPENRHVAIEKRAHITEVKVKRLHPDAVIPKKAHAADAGFDFVAVEDTIIEPGETALIKTGLAFELPEGFEMQIRPRSGVTLKTKLRVQLGTVDSNYRGEVGVIVDNIASAPQNPSPEKDRYLFTLNGGSVEVFPPEEYLWNTYIVRKGEKLAQMVIHPIPEVEITEVEELGVSDRGEKGFGSTGI